MEIDARVYELYDEYCHGGIDRREFLLRAAALAAGGLAMAQGVPFYGAAAPAAEVPKIKAALLVQLAENDPRINAMWPEFEAALKSAGVRYEMHQYDGTQHGFHNNSTPRYREAAAKLAWARTVAHFRRHLA